MLVKFACKSFLLTVVMICSATTRSKIVIVLMTTQSRERSERQRFVAPVEVIEGVEKGVGVSVGEYRNENRSECGSISFRMGGTPFST